MACLAVGSADAAKLTPEIAYGATDLSGPRARGVALSPDGTAVTYLKAKADDQRMTDLWIADVAGGEPRLLIDGRALIPEGREVSEAEKTRRERQGVQSRGVVDYAWDEQGRAILAPVEGDLWLFERASGKVRRLTDSDSDEIDAKISPKGRFVSFVRNDNLYALPLAGGPEIALTQGGTDLKSWGTADYIAQEEMGRFTGYWWAPDDARIAVAHVDQTGVDIVERPDITATGVVIVPQRYPRAGRANSVTELYVLDVAGERRVKVDLGSDRDIYVARVNWSKDGRTLYVQRESRDQRRLDLLAVDPDTGASQVILSESAPQWVELTNDFKPLKEGRFIWSSERSGYRHLYLYGADGKLVRQLTHGDWPVDEVAGVDETRGVVLFGASMDTPIERRLYAVSLNGGEPKALTPAGGWWTADVAHSGDAFAGTYHDPKTPPRTGLYRADGSLVRWIEENRLTEGHPYWPYAERLRVPEFGTLKAADGQVLHWSMRTPPGFDPAKRYPVVVQVYGGPGVATVTRSWAAPEDQIYLEAGYILFRLDNRGSANRSVAFKTAIHKQMGGPEVADQIAGATYLKSLPYVDPARIGVTGFSYGGYMTLLLLSEPGTPFSAGLSGAPVTDWALYDTHYTERYMLTPQENPAGYAKSAVTGRLDNLKPGSLFLLHGMADDNVSFDNSTRVMAALQAKGTAFELMTYPGLRHRAGWTQAHKLHRARATLDFFGRKFMPTPAP